MIVQQYGGGGLIAGEFSKAVQQSRAGESIWRVINNYWRVELWTFTQVCAKTHRTDCGHWSRAGSNHSNLVNNNGKFRLVGRGMSKLSRVLNTSLQLTESQHVHVNAKSPVLMQENCIAQHALGHEGHERYRDKRTPTNLKRPCNATHRIPDSKAIKDQKIGFAVPAPRRTP